mmetsp:Transcript_62367/g.167314  ORF Transcript_62367/g.167314 Transcript_62367/m.167314 type:complete len:87 (+) Transcript_62367:425-685(+)
MILKFGVPLREFFMDCFPFSRAMKILRDKFDAFVDNSANVLQLKRRFEAQIASLDTSNLDLSRFDAYWASIMRIQVNIAHTPLESV